MSLWKDQTAYLLTEQEKPRTPYPWADDNQCPHCGATGSFEKNEKEGIGHCLSCGTWIFREIFVGHSRTIPFPYRIRRALRLTTCPECRKEFHTKSLHSDVRCPECREERRKALNKQYRANARAGA